jgi:hypothetical protein
MTGQNEFCTSLVAVLPIMRPVNGDRLRVPTEIIVAFVLRAAFKISCHGLPDATTRRILL